MVLFLTKFKADAYQNSSDRNIITRRDHLNFIVGDFGTELTDNDIYLMEMKLVSQIPLWLCQYLSRMKIYDTVTQHKNIPMYGFSKLIFV